MENNDKLVDIAGDGRIELDKLVKSISVTELTI